MSEMTPPFEEERASVLDQDVRLQRRQPGHGHGAAGDEEVGHAPPVELELIVGGRVVRRVLPCGDPIQRGQDAHEVRFAEVLLLRVVLPIRPTR